MKASGFIIFTFIFFIPGLLNAQDFWKQAPGLYGAYVQTLAASGNNIYAGTIDGGIFKSTDNGSSWHQTGNDLPDLRVASISAFDNSVFAVVGYYNHRSLYLSTDFGDSWIRADSGMEVDSTAPGDIQEEGNDPNTIISHNNKIFCGTNHGVFVSSDNGKHWTCTGLKNIRILSITAQDSILLAGSYGVIYRSSDNGNTWLETSVPEGKIFRSFVYCGSSIFAGGDFGLFVSNDNGLTWKQTPGNAFSASVITANENDLYVVLWDDGIYRSSDFGQSWSKVYNNTNTIIYSIISHNSFIFAGTGGEGILYSSNRGNNWNFSEYGLTNTFVNGYAKKDDMLYAATNRGVYYSTDNGINWYKKGLINLVVNSIAVNDSLIIAGSYFGLFTSSDNGDTWIECGPKETLLYVGGLAVNNSDIFAGNINRMIYHTSDKGKTWTSKGLEERYIFSLLISENNVLAGTFDGVFCSTDKGTNWNETNLQDIQVLTLYSNGSEIYAGTQGEGVFRSTDNGLTWKNAGLKNSTVTCFTHSGLNILAGTSSEGIFISTGKDTNWNTLNTGLETLDIQSLSISGNNILAGTSNMGTWYMPVSDIVAVNTSEKLINEFRLMQNYPNPFNPVTNIEFQVPRSLNVELVTLKVYDIIGNEIALLVNEYKTAGIYSVKFDAANLASGLYIYTLKCGANQLSGKMHLIK